jgi:8-oxo-dGTP diphosphatase
MDPIAPEGCWAADRGWSGSPIDTAHLRLRRLQPEDADEVTRLLDDWEVVRNTSNIPFPYERKLAGEFITKVTSESAGGRALVFAVEERSTARLLGCVGATIHQGAAEIGYWLGRPYWGNGFATEALRRCLRLLFRNFSIDLAWASVMPDNKASRRVLDKAGFTFDQRRKVDLPARGYAADLDVLTLRRSEWDAAMARRPILLVAAVALVDADGRVLVAQRPAGKSMAGQWEFPGGKVQAGETPEAALVRELDEELGVGVGQACLAPLAFASHDYDTFHLLMPLYVCRQWLGTPQPREGQRLAWGKPNELAALVMPPADQPLIALLRDWL